MSDIQFVWEDRPYTIWASRELSKLLGSIEIENIVLSDVVVLGECSVCMSRGKKIGIFELDVRCKFTSKNNGCERGEILIPELVSEDVEDDDYVVKIMGDDSKNVVKNKVVKEIRRRVKEFSKRLMRADKSDGNFRREDTVKEGDEIVVIKKEKIEIKQRSVPSSRPKLSVGPSKNVEFTIHVSDIDEKSVKSERYRFFRELTLLESDSIGGAAEKAISSIVDQGWRSDMFPSVVLVGPMPLDGSKRQICLMGSHKGFKRGMYLPSRRMLGKCLQNSQGNTLRVSPLDARDALDSALEDAEEEEKKYREKEAKRLKKLAFKKKQKEKRKKMKEKSAAARMKKEEEEMKKNTDVSPVIIEELVEEETKNLDKSPVYSWGAAVDEVEEKEKEKKRKNKSSTNISGQSNVISGTTTATAAAVINDSLIIEDVTDEIDTLQLE